MMIPLLRGARLASPRNQPGGSLIDDVLIHRVFEHLRLPPIDYASVPDAKGAKARLDVTARPDAASNTPAPEGAAVEELAPGDPLPAALRGLARSRW